MRPIEEITLAVVLELAIETGRPMGVSDHSLDRSDESTACEARCDVWAEDALIPGG